MTVQLDIEKIAKGLGAKRMGKVRATSGHFGVLQLVAEIQSRFQVPKGGGRATDPNWKTKRLLPLADESLKQLETLAQELGERLHVHIEPMQVAALLLESILARVTEHTEAPSPLTVATVGGQ